MEVRLGTSSKLSWQFGCQPCQTRIKARFGDYNATEYKKHHYSFQSYTMVAMALMSLIAALAIIAVLDVIA